MVIDSPRAGETVLGSFRLERVLGSGSFALAFLATQLGTDRKAVVKFPHPHLLAGPHADDIRHRFQIEARAASRVLHPHVVTIYTVGETESGLPAIAMEYVDGDTFAQRLAAAPLPLVQVGALGLQLGGALWALHEVGIIHRDLSPGNVIVTGEGSGVMAKLLDFGVAKLRDAPTRTLGPMGTPGYLAPEQLRGEVNPRSDVYSLGALLWWALTGQERPDDISDGSLMRTLGHTRGPDPRRVRPEIPTPLSAVVRRMMVPDPQHRIGIDEFLVEWRAALDTLAVPEVVNVSGSSRISSRMTMSVEAPRKVAIVVGNSILHSLMTTYLSGAQDFVIETCGLRELARSNPGTYAAAVLDADLPGVDLVEVLGMLSDCYDELGLVVIGGAAHATTEWAAFGADAFVLLPESLERLRVEVSRALGRKLSTGDFSDRRLSMPTITKLRRQGVLRQRVETFIGGMPQWLAELEISVETGPLGAGVKPCTQLIACADELGLRDLARVARAAQAFINADDVDGAAAFVTAISAEYHALFPLVVGLIPSSREPSSTS